MIATKVVNWC